MPTHRFKFAMESTVSGPLNPAYCTLAATDASGGATWLEETATRMAMHLMVAAYWFGEAGQKIVDVTQENAASPGFVPQSLSQTVYSAIRTSQSLTTELPNWTTGLLPPAYGPGSGGSNGRGDSACMQLKTPTPGRSGRGRIFYPFLTPSAIDTATGLLSTTRSSNVETNFGVLLDVAVSPYPAIDMVVWSPTLGAASLVNNVKVTKIPSRLRSRTK